MKKSIIYSQLVKRLFQPQSLVITSNMQMINRALFKESNWIFFHRKQEISHHSSLDGNLFFWSKCKTAYTFSSFPADIIFDWNGTLKVGALCKQVQSDLKPRGEVLVFLFNGKASVCELLHSFLCSGILYQAGWCLQAIRLPWSIHRSPCVKLKKSPRCHTDLEMSR